MQHSYLLLFLALTAQALHLTPAHQTQEVDKLYFQSEFADLTAEVEFVKRQIEGWQGAQAPFLKDRIAENKAGVQQLQRTLEKYQLYVNKVTPLCPGVSSFNRTEIRKYVVYLEEKQTAMVAALQGCENCQDLTSKILTLQNMTSTYIQHLNQTLDGQFCPPPSPLGESALGMVNLNLSFFRSNLAAPNWYYGSTTASDYKIYLFRRSTTYNLTSCPLSRPFVQDSEQICFQCPSGALFNLGLQRCDTCPSDAILNVKTGACVPCDGQKIAANGSLVCKECDWSQGIVLNSTTGKCEACGSDSYVEKTSKKCLKIDCPERTPRFDRATQKCVACPPSYIIDETNRTNCIKTNFVGLCPPETPYYSRQSHTCQPCPSGTAYKAQNNECINQNINSHLLQSARSYIINTPDIDENLYNQAKKCELNYSSLNLQTKKCQKCKYPIKLSIERGNESIYICKFDCLPADKTEIQGQKYEVVDCAICPLTLSPLKQNDRVANCYNYQYCVNSTKTYQESTDQCVQTSTLCFANETYKKDINKCVQTVQTCLPAQIYDPKFNKCVGCPQPTQTYDLNTSQCVDTASTCKSTETYVAKSNKCVSTASTCLHSEIYDPKLNKCVGPCPGSTKTYDFSKSECVETASTCLKNETYVRKSNKCISKKSLCLKTQYYQESTFRCLSVSSSCKPTEFYDATLIKCVDRKSSCRSGESYDEERKKCVKDVICAADERFNFDIEACEKRLILCREGIEYFEKTTKTCKKYEFVTSPYVPDLLYGNPIQRYVEQYQSARKLNPLSKDCPLPTPFANSNSDCIACPTATPYFDLLEKKCLPCAHYDSNSRRCLQAAGQIAELQRKKDRSEKMGRIPI